MCRASPWPSEVVLTIGWNVLSRVELEPAQLRG